MKKDGKTKWLSQKDYDQKRWEEKKAIEKAKEVVLSPKAKEMKERVGYVF